MVKILQGKLSTCVIVSSARQALGAGARNEQLNIGQVHGRRGPPQYRLHVPIQATPHNLVHGGIPATLRLAGYVVVAARRGLCHSLHARPRMRPGRPALRPFLLEPAQDDGRPPLREWTAAEQRDLQERLHDAEPAHGAPQRAAAVREHHGQVRGALPCRVMASRSARGTASPSASIASRPAGPAAAASSPRAASAGSDVLGSSESGRSARTAPLDATSRACSSFADRLRSAARHGSFASGGTSVAPSVATRNGRSSVVRSGKSVLASDEMDRSSSASSWLLHTALSSAICGNFLSRPACTMRTLFLKTNSRSPPALRSADKPKWREIYGWTENILQITVLPFFPIT